MKLMNFTSMSGKFLAVLPLASSQSPSSGDHYLLMRFDDIQRNNGQQETYVRALLSGNDEYFIILVVDAGNTECITPFDFFFWPIKCIKTK